MFTYLIDFSYKRSLLQASGFFIAYLFFGLILLYFGLEIFYPLLKPYPQLEQNIAFIYSAVYTGWLYFAVIAKKNRLNKPLFLITGLIGAIIGYYVGLFFSLVIPSAATLLDPYAHIDENEYIEHLPDTGEPSLEQQ